MRWGGGKIEGNSYFSLFPYIYAAKKKLCDIFDYGGPESS
jgi:hypothetical protein